MARFLCLDVSLQTLSMSSLQHPSHITEQGFRFNQKHESVLSRKTNSCATKALKHRVYGLKSKEGIRPVTNLCFYHLFSTKCIQDTISITKADSKYYALWLGATVYSQYGCVCVRSQFMTDILSININTNNN